MTLANASTAAYPPRKKLGRNRIIENSKLRLWTRGIADPFEFVTREIPNARSVPFLSCLWHSITFQTECLEMLYRQVSD